MALPVSDPAGMLAIVLALALIAPLLAEKARLPAIVGIALAGILAGPHGLGLLDTAGPMGSFGKVGMLYAFLAAGAELDSGRIGRAGARGRGAIMAFLPFAFGIPFAAGLLAGRLLLGLELLPSLLLGCVLAAFSTLPYQSAARLGLTRQRAATAAAGSELVGGAAAMAGFAIAARLSAPSGGEPLLSALLALAWAAASILVLPRAAALFFKKVKPEGTLEFVFVLALSFACAFGAGLAGVEPAAGAFLAGILLCRFIPSTSILMNRLRFVGDALLLPCFMVYAGALADPIRAFADAGSLRTALVVLGAGLGAPWLAAGAAGIVLRMSRQERRLLWGLSASRATPALAMALAGYELGVVDRSVLDGTVFLVLASCALGDMVARRAARALAGAGEGRSERLSAAPERILVAVSNPSSIRGLVELAFLMRGHGNEEPVYPVAVVAESADREAELAAAENRLAQAVVQGVSAGVPVIPSTRVCVNAHEGLLLAARECRASAIVIGWNKAPKLSHAFFGSVIEQVVLGGAGLVVVARATRPLGEVTQLALVLPAMIERHPGFDRALAAVAALLAQTGARLTAYALAGREREAREALSGIKAHGSTQVVGLSSWKELGPEDKAAGGSRAFILFSARPGESAWHPAVEKLPHRLGEEYPDAPLFIFYLPEPSRIEAESAEPAAAPSPGEPPEPRERDLLDRAIAAGRVRPAMRETAIADGLRELLRPAFGQDRKALNKLAALFTQMAQSQPIELEPGILLLHAHLEEASETMVFFGARPEGFRLVALEESVRVIVILCAPADQSAEEHLATLGEIARLFKDGKVEERLGLGGAGGPRGP